ncbi:MAG: response regulator transcription factor [Alphaproteobacteria bacterium]|nr:response regulator transcription factor [Alphaproteobacteria bacterium]
MKPRRILVADDQPIYRHGLVAVLCETFARKVKIVQAASYAEGRCLLLETREAGSFDLVICALRMADFDDFAGLRRLREAAGTAPVLVLSDSDCAEDVRQALACGARGFVSKHEREPLLRLAIQMVIEDGVYVPTRYLSEPVGEAAGALPPGRAWRAPENGAAPVRGRFTPRELMVLQRITEGRSNKEIARTLNISESTVKIHVRSICQKSMVKNRTQAAMLASNWPDLIGGVSH